jgi:hypothetical protein
MQAGDAPVHESRRQDFLPLGDETTANYVDTVWVYWNLFDFVRAGRPDCDTRRRIFGSRLLEEHYFPGSMRRYLNAEGTERRNQGHDRRGERGERQA